ncbi:MAG: wax ester/triacylglycerol synthase domain-containing protein [Actinomycetes bacterium]
MLSLPLRQDRPMWQYYVLDRLEGGRIAHLIRIHHAMIDGDMVPGVLDLLSDEPMVNELEVLLEAADKVAPATGGFARGRTTSAARRRGRLRPAREPTQMPG